MSMFCEYSAAEVKNDLLAGIVSCFSVIPEVVGFCLLAGVSPTLGLWTSIAFLILGSFLGGRPAMVSAGAGSMALVVMTLIANYGTEYLFAAVLLAGVVQLLLGFLHADKLIRFVPATVMLGFVDALAIVIFSAQISSLKGGSLLMFVFVAVAMAIVYLFPKLTDKVPSTLVALLTVTALSLLTGGTTTSVGSMAQISAGLPNFWVPTILADPQTWAIVLPYAVSLAFVGLLETMLTEQVVDEMTGTFSDANRELKSQGVANVASGFLGAMPGCAMIGQAMVNVNSGGRGRLSTLCAGVLLCALVVVGGELLNYVPLAALVGVMITVAISTFDWKQTRRVLVDGFGNPSKTIELITTLVTIGVVVSTKNLAFGAGAGMVVYYGARTILGEFSFRDAFRKLLHR